MVYWRVEEHECQAPTIVYIMLLPLRNVVHSCCLYPADLVLQIPGPTRKWVDQIIRWDFKRVVTAHFSGPTLATPADFR